MSRISGLPSKSTKAALMTDCCLNVINSVQGVQGVQGRFCPTLHSYRPRAAWLCALLCRVCRVDLRTRARAIYNSTLIIINTSRAYMYPAHPAHPAHAAFHAGYSCAGYFSHPAHPAHSIFLYQKNNEEDNLWDRECR